ncbi:Exportin-4 [Paragonimus heterotremus]|uniref:Exportin-4 n=1 Tax=Paragonimus heterotremus TaxID=100268 RepID=A0A8J4SWE9_9TREM|nr:Exportin-4 [Paragonimus heterotremus]
MDAVLTQLEEAASVQLTACTSEERRLAEAKILQFRSQSQPYELCYLILNQSSNDFLLYEAGRCLSHAVVREWTEVFSSSVNDGDNSKATQLLAFLLNWASQRGQQVSTASRQRVLGAAGALVKRAAAAHAEEVAAAWRSNNIGMNTTQRRLARMRVLISPPDDPGPPCPILLRLIEHIERLIQPVVQGDMDIDPLKENGAIHQCTLGLCILSALLDELSYSEDSTQVDLPLETHIFLRARFQDYELIRLFHGLLCLTDRLVHSWANFPLSSLPAEHSELLFRLVSCLDIVISWDFLPRSLVGFLASLCKRPNHEVCFRPSSKWAPVFGSESLQATLQLFIKLHTLVRSSDLLGARTLSCFARLSSMTGPLTDPDTLNWTEELEQQPPSTAYQFRLLIFMDNLNFWLEDDTTDMSASTNSVLSAFSSEEQLALSEECAKRLVNPTSLPRIRLSQLFAYELPILSELVLTVVLRVSSAWEPVELALSLPSSVASGHCIDRDPQTIFQNASIVLVVLDRFFERLCSLIIQCLHCLTKWVHDPDGDGRSAHEAVERLFNIWVGLVDSIPSTGSDPDVVEGELTGLDGDWRKETTVATTLPLPLTTGRTEELENRSHHVKKLLHLLVSNVSRHRVRLFQFYLLSKLGPDVGLRSMDGLLGENIDLELDEDDLTASENSLFACGFCGLAATDSSTRLLLQLTEDRINQLVQIPKDQSDQTAVIGLYEDLHWILLVTGHLIVTGPASLTSVLRWSSLLGTEFSIAPQLLRMNAQSTVDVSTSRRFLCLAAGQRTTPHEIWPPRDVDLDKVPPLIRLIGSLYRLLWLQTSLNLGSAQLLEDNLWLLTRVATTYLCRNVMDPTVLTDNKLQSCILDILQTDSSVPSPAHRGQGLSDSPMFGQLEARQNGTVAPADDVITVCVQGLMTCGRLALSNWSGEPQILTAVIRLIKVLGRLVPNPSRSLVCPAWYEICAILCGSQSITETWPNLTTDSLIELTEACLCGSWAIDKERLSPSLTDWQADSNNEPLLLQILHSLRARLLYVLASFSRSSSEVDNSVVDQLLNCLANLRGLARALASLAPQSNAATDLISLVWTGVLYPALKGCAQVLIVQCHNSTEIVQNVLSLFSEVTESCLIYLASIPAAASSPSAKQYSSEHLEPSDVEQGVLGSEASANFLNLSVTLCRNYAKQNTNKASFDPTAEDDRVAELRLLLNLLTRISAHEFELRLSGTYVSLDPVNDRSPTDALAPSTPVRTVEVTVIGLGYLLPLITESMLMVPDLCNPFYSLALYACELRIEGFSQLSDEKLTYFGRLIRLGIFGSAASDVPVAKTSISSSFSGPDNSVTHRCLELFTILADYCLDLRSLPQPSDKELQAANRLSSLLGLDTQLLMDLFGLITKSSYPVDLESVFSSLIISLIHMNPSAYAQLVTQWINSCPDSDTRDRLHMAFERLGTPSNPSMNCPPITCSYTAAFHDRKPTRLGRTDFQQRFHTFVAEVRAFVCRG